MNKFKLLLQGGNELVITEAEKVMVEGALKDKDSFIEINHNYFRTGIVKGIFEIRLEVAENDKPWQDNLKEWTDWCKKRSTWTPEAKTQAELDDKIIPGLLMNRIELPEEQIQVMEKDILAFFKANMLYPRCPSRIWWSYIAGYVHPNVEKKSLYNFVMGRWWKYIFRQDDSIEKWIKYQ